MIYLGSPTDLMAPVTKCYICVVAYTYDVDDSMVCFSHVFTKASCKDSAYDSIEMLDLENRLISQGATLVNNYVAEV